MASVPPPVEDFVTEDEASHTSPLCTPSPIVFPEAPVARIAKMTRLGTKRLAEKYKKIKIAFEEYLFKVQTFLDPMANVAHAVISRKDYALASLERAQEESWPIASSLENARQAQEFVDKAFEAAKVQFQEELA